MLSKNTRCCGRERSRSARTFKRTIPIPSYVTLLITRRGRVRCILSHVVHRGLAACPRLLPPLVDPFRMQPYASLTTNSSSQVVRFFPHPTDQVWTFGIVRSDFLTAESGNSSSKMGLRVEVHERAVRSGDKENGRNAGILFCRFPWRVWRFVEELPEFLVGSVRRHVPRPHHPFRPLGRWVGVIRLAHRFLTWRRRLVRRV